MGIGVDQMAVDEDYTICRSAFSRWAEQILPSGRVLVCSPDVRQLEILKLALPDASIVPLGATQWDLNHPCPTTANLIVACNVFHYSPDPHLWFRNVFAACRHFWLQDLFLRYRGPEGLGEDGDRARYGLGVGGCTDLAAYTGRLLDYTMYDGGSYSNLRTTVHFVASFRGDL